MEMLRKLRSRLCIAWARAHGVRIDPHCMLEGSVVLSRGVASGRQGDVHLQAGARLLRGACLEARGGRIIVGTTVFIGQYAVIYGQGGVTIGDNALISMHCRILSSNHAIPASGVPIRSQPDTLLPTTIGADVWLGAGVTVLGGVTIGDGCVVGAGSVVSRDLPPNSIAVGVPARVVRSRAGSAPA